MNSDAWIEAEVRAKDEEREKADREASREREREQRKELHRMGNGVYEAPRTSAAHSLIDAPMIAVDHFDLSMIEVNETGARILVRPLSRHEALELTRKYSPPSCSIYERGQNDLEQELQLEPAPRPKLRSGTQLLVMLKKSWKDIRWFLVTYESDGDGVVE